jgi:hypothetical protein
LRLGIFILLCRIDENINLQFTSRKKFITLSKILHQKALSQEWLELSGYLFSVLIPVLVSSVRHLWVSGLIGLIGVVVAQIFYAYAFGSIWCFFGSLISLFVYSVVRKLSQF